MSRRTIELAFGFFMLALGLFLLFYHDPAGEADAAGVTFGPLFFPHVLLVVWCLLSVGIIVEALMTPAKAATPYAWRKVLVMGAIIAVCVLLMDRVGFLLSSLVFFFASCAIFGFRRPLPLALVGTGFCVGCWYVFENLLQIPLPSASWF